MEITEQEFVEAMNEFKYDDDYEIFSDDSKTGLVKIENFGTDSYNWKHSLERNDPIESDKTVSYNAFGDIKDWIKQILRPAIAEHKKDIGPIEVYKLDRVTDELNDEHMNFSNIDKIFCQMTVSPKSETGVMCLITGKDVYGSSKNGPETTIRDVESIEKALEELNYEVDSGKGDN
jgi:hypothetical protein